MVYKDHESSGPERSILRDLPIAKTLTYGLPGFGNRLTRLIGEMNDGHRGFLIYRFVVEAPQIEDAHRGSEEAFRRIKVNRDADIEISTEVSTHTDSNGNERRVISVSFEGLKFESPSDFYALGRRIAKIGEGLAFKFERRY